MPEAEIDASECGSCTEGVDDISDTPACPESKRPCGHHCNHVWTHDECDWCGAVFGADDEPSTSPVENDHTLTDAEKRLRDWLMQHPEGGEMWMIVKGGFRKSYGLGATDALNSGLRSAQTIVSRIRGALSDPTTPPATSGGGRDA